MAKLRNDFAALEERIKEVRDFADKLDPGDRMANELSKYLCVLGSGLIEAKIRHLVLQLISQTKPHTKVANIAYLASERWSNPDTDTILRIAKAIDANITKAIEANIEGEIKEAVNSLVGNRHNIAHGKDVSISLKRVEGYLDKLKDLFPLLDKLIAT